MPPDVQARCGVRVGQDIAVPLVDLASATKAAKARVHALRAQEPVRAAKAAIVEKHGARRGTNLRNRNARKAPAPLQRCLDL